MLPNDGVRRWCRECGRMFRSRNRMAQVCLSCLLVKLRAITGEKRRAPQKVALLNRYAGEGCA